MPQDEDPPSPDIIRDIADGQKAADTNGGLFGWLRRLFKPKNNGEHLRDAIEEYLEEYIEEMDEGQDGTESVASHERLLISNILKIRDMTVLDVMIPRADIAAIDVEATKDELMALLADKQVSRIPVYRDTLDDVIGTVHIKDILTCLAAGRDIKLADMVRDVPVVSPAMAVLDLLLLMKENRKHMVMVVDEFGGIDGLATIGDVIEAIVGEVEDEFDTEEQPQIMERPDGTLLADARVDIEEFEEKFGQILTEDEREDVDTLGGLVFTIAGRVPARGEVIRHESGMIFEIVDADPRRVNTLRIKNIPKAA
jgi:magnesium and cobalt transporter